MKRRRSVSLAIVFASVAVGLSIALLVGWTFFAVNTGNTTMMVLGILSFVVIMTVIISSAVLLVREIMEVRRQTTSSTPSPTNSRARWRLYACAQRR